MNARSGDHVECFEYSQRQAKEPLAKSSHSPQASAWGLRAGPILRNRFNGLRVFEPIKLHAAVSLAFGFIRTPGKPLKRFLSNDRVP